MADFSVIADVGSTLVNVLRRELCPHPIARPEQIGLASPDDKGDLSLCLYLYHIAENGEHRQTHMVRRGAGAQQFPPLMLNLSYLILAYSTAETHSRATDEQLILGRAMQVLYDHSILRGSVLEGALSATDEELRLVFDAVQAESMRDLWNFNDVPFKLGVSITISPVQLDSTRVRATKRVLEPDIRMKDKE